MANEKETLEAAKKELGDVTNAIATKIQEAKRTVGTLDATVSALETKRDKLTEAIKAAKEAWLEESAELDQKRAAMIADARKLETEVSRLTRTQAALVKAFALAKAGAAKNDVVAALVKELTARGLVP